MDNAFLVGCDDVKQEPVDLLVAKLSKVVKIESSEKTSESTGRVNLKRERDGEQEKKSESANLERRLSPWHFVRHLELYRSEGIKLSFLLSNKYTRLLLTTSVRKNPARSPLLNHLIESTVIRCTLLLSENRSHSSPISSGSHL